MQFFIRKSFTQLAESLEGFFKREGRPTENETLVSRLIDRPIRPLFPSSFTNEVQVICTVMSADKDQNPDIASMIGASAALSISGIPFQGPIGAARVGFIDDSFVINPSNEQLKGSYLDMVVAGTKDAVLMVESEAKELDEDLMLGAVLFGHQEMQKVVDACNELKSKVNPDMWEVEEVPTIKEYETQISSNFLDEIENAFKIADKSSRGEAISSVREKIKSSHEDLDELEQARLMTAFKNVEKSVVRKSILSNQPRIDGRDLDTVRPIEVETSFLQKTHGSSLFTRGETQAIVAATLGSTKDAQRIENLSGESTDAFMLHYNFPGYSVGEISFPGGPKRREIGHGNLAKRAIKAVLPDLDSFGYTLRVVSEITESNGSSSMATVCGTSLSLMDAGVPITNAVAGVAMGLIKEGDDFAVLTDILGDEDHLGDMDFKVAGTVDGVTALQMDIKIEGINEQIMDAALEKAKAARMHILDVMNAVIDKPKEVSDNAPAMKKFTVHQDKIKEIIGKGGAVIKNIQQESGASVDINDDGVVTVFGENQSVMQAALSMIETIIEDPEVNKIYDGKVVKIVDFGAFVNILPGKDGLLHISEISEERTENVSDVLSEGDTIKVKLIGFDRGKLKLSAKAVDKE
ncbi:MAG: polyribonucleotide nucleotidyltransferase [Gammaproteobacteria bacterium]|nr:MAG: polyribonucleotide nucleotidyltransferase [Gammaproteobacteria bacterium]